MSQSDSIADVFVDGPIDVRKPKNVLDESRQLETLFDQAYCLARCANLVYPKAREKDNKAKQESAERLERLMQRWNGLNWAKLFSEMERDGDAGEPNARGLELGRTLLSEQEWNEQRELGHLENDIDEIAADLHRAYCHAVRRKYLYPWRWLSQQRLTDINRAKLKWGAAHELWVEEARRRIEGKDDDNVLKTFVENGGELKFVSRGGIEYFLAGDENLIVLCFRGTEANKVGDVLTDLLAWQTKEPKGKAKFHDGFWSALDGVWDDLQRSLQTEFSEGESRSTAQAGARRLWITGHSLGGALATLAAYRLAREKIQNSDSKLPEIGGVFTFGQPRVGDRQFAREYKQLAFPRAEGKAYLNDRHFRFVNNNDVVTVVPPKLLGIASVIFSGALSLAFRAKKNTTSPSAGDGTAASNGPTKSGQQWTIEYSDVGRVVLANRADRLRLLTPDRSLGWNVWNLGFWWPVLYRLGRVGSWRLLSLKPCGGFLERFLPGIPDHSMLGYVRVLEYECAHQAFARDAVQAMKQAFPENEEDRAKQERGLLKVAERAWAGFGRHGFETALRAGGTHALDPKLAGQAAWQNAPDRDREDAINEARRNYA